MLSVNRWYSTRFFDTTLCSLGSGCHLVRRRFVTCRVLRSPRKNCALRSFGTTRTTWLPRRSLAVWSSAQPKRLRACCVISHASDTMFAMRSVCVEDVQDVHIDAFDAVVVSRNTRNTARATEIHPFLTSYTYSVHTPYILRTYSVHTPCSFS